MFTQGDRLSLLAGLPRYPAGPTYEYTIYDKMMTFGWLVLQWLDYYDCVNNELILLRTVLSAGHDMQIN